MNVYRHLEHLFISMSRFTIQYEITCYAGESIHEKLEWMCLEQSVELPAELVEKDILDLVKGQVTKVNQLTENRYEAVISWPVSNAGNDITQFLNILYGNISLKKGIRIISVEWAKLNELFKGAKFGIEGIRKKFDIPRRAMACGVLKPMGLSADELASLAGTFADGGIDLIKDDHGLANQSYAPFQERVQKVVKAVSQASDQSGRQTRYFPNITASGAQLIDNYQFAAECGADGVMIIPGLCGFEIMHQIAQSEIELPIIAHPAFTGTMVTDPEHGFIPAFLYGELIRALGADFAIYPNTGGRFSFSVKECLDLNVAARKSVNGLKPIFPMPGGGMKQESIPYWIEKYGSDTVFLLGASILQHKEGISKAVKDVQQALENAEA